MDFDSNKTLAECYNLDPSDYIDISIRSFSFSNRVMNRLIVHEINTAADLLRTTLKTMSAFKGFGRGCFDEVEEVCASLSTDSLHDIVRKNIPTANSLYQYREQIIMGDFSFVESSLTDLMLAEAYKDAYLNLDKELITACYHSSEKIMPIIEMCNQFCDDSKYRAKLQNLIYSIPKTRQTQQTLFYVQAFTADETLRKKLLSFCVEPTDCICDLSCAKIPMGGSDYVLLTRFLQWCAFDIGAEIKELLLFTCKEPRNWTVIQRRASRQTLEEIGKDLELTRERVRQIESKARQRFAQMQNKMRILAKISADRNGDTIITPLEIAEYCNENIDELLFFLRGYESGSYTYDSQLNVFVVGDDSLHGQTLAYIETLPDVINIRTLPKIFKKAQEDNNLSEEIIEKAIKEAYRQTGDVYHRNRLRLRDIYETIIREYYPEGIHPYDVEETKQFRERILYKYGTINLPEQNRALAARIADVCVLCGRGKYKLKQKSYIPEELAVCIYDYMMQSEHSIFLTNTLFNVFEDDLLAAGIDNKYYLQGVLHELYGDKLTFRRDYISKDREFTSVYANVISYIKKSDYPVPKKELFRVFPGITEIVLTLATSDESILNFFGEYLHAQKLIISSAERLYLDKLIQSVIADGVAHHTREIYQIINIERPEILTRNAVLFPFGTFSVLEYLFKDKYQFSRPYIGENNIAMDRPGERLHDLVYANNKFLLSDIREFAKENRFQITSILEHINTYNDEFLLVNSNTIMRIEDTGITEEIAIFVENMILSSIENTTPIRELECLYSLPRINVPWSDWLVYSLLYRWATKLEIATSSNQMRMAFPLVAPIGKMDTELFVTNKYVEDAWLLSLDDLDDIDALLEDIIDVDILEEEL